MAATGDYERSSPADATKIYQYLHLIRANDRHLRPISRRIDQPNRYHGPFDAISKGEVTVPAVLDTLAYLSVLNEDGRAAVTYTSTPMGVTLFVSQDGLVGDDTRILEHLSSVWMLLRELKDASDLEDASRAEEVRSGILTLFYRACMHRVVGALREEMEPYKRFVDTMRTLEDVEDVEKLESVFRTIERLTDVLLTPETEQRSLSEEQCVEVTMLCDALHTMLTSCSYELRARWHAAYRKMSGSHSRFTLSAYMVSIIRLHRYVNYLLLIASPQSLLRKYLDQPPDIVVVPTASSYSVTVDVSPATLFPLLTEAVGYTDPPLTSEYVTQRLYAESPQLVGKSEITVEGTAHCEARLAVYIFDRFTVASHMGLSSIPCYACSRFISACRETFGYFTLTFDQSFREEFDLPWVLPPPFREDGGYSGQENISLTNMIWEHMCTRISDDLEVLWSEEGQEELAAYKRYLRRSKAREE